MANYNQFLAELEVYPTREQIDEASNYAQEKATEYLLAIDPTNGLTVEEGEVYIENVDDLDEETAINVQVVFDEHFGSKVFELQTNN